MRVASETYGVPLARLRQQQLFLTLFAHLLLALLSSSMQVMNLIFVLVARGRTGGIAEKKKFNDLIKDFVFLIKKEVGVECLLRYEQMN